MNNDCENCIYNKGKRCLNRESKNYTKYIEDIKECDFDLFRVTYKPYIPSLLDNPDHLDGLTLKMYLHDPITIVSNFLKPKNVRDKLKNILVINDAPFGNFLIERYDNSKEKWVYVSHKIIHQ